MTPSAVPASARLRVLILSPYFLPAEQGGGSVRAVLHLTQQLYAFFEFVIVTRAHDLRSPQPYDAPSQEAARRTTGLDIRYLPAGLQGLRQLRAILREDFDLLYLQSLMAPDLGLWALLCHRWLAGGKTPLLIAPRGELMPGAMAHRTRAKQAYLAAMRGLNLLKAARFHATSAEEATAIRCHFGSQLPVHVAPDLPPRQPHPTHTTHAARAPGPLRVLFLSRIDPVKNLGFALDVLSGMSCQLEFNIAGPIGNDAVWADCQQRMQRLPPGVRCRYLGAVPHAQVAALMEAHDVFFLPTLGENHGYVISEALAAGCAVLLSDRTPWRGLAASGVGADLPLSDMLAFRSTLHAQAALDDGQRSAQRQRCRDYAHERARADTAVECSRAMLALAAQPKARMDSINAGHSGGR